MATITINRSSPVGTLSDRIFGTYVSKYFHQDYAVSSFQALCAAVGFEHIRANNDFDASDYAGVADCKAFLTAVAPPDVLLEIGAPVPATIPSGNSDPTVQADVHAGVYSPASWVAVYEDWVAAGINVTAVEVGNEPNFLGVTSSRLPSPGYIPPTQPNVAWAIDYYNTHLNLYSTAIRASAAGLGRSVDIVGCVASNLHAPDSYSHTKAFVDQTLETGIGTPVDNSLYCDVISAHTYGYSKTGGNGIQGKMCSFFYDSGDPTDSTKNMNLQATRYLRPLMDANGFSAAPISDNEVSLSDTTNPLTYVSASGDVAVTVAVCELVADGVDIENIAWTAFNRGGASTEQNFFSGAATVTAANHRYYCLRDLVGPFLKGYKQLVSTTVTGSGSTSGTTPDPATTRIHAAAGMNTAGDKLGVLVCNIDLTNSETVTISHGFTPAGQVTGVYLPQNASIGALPAVTPFTASTSFTQSVAPGEAYLFLIPTSSQTSGAAGFSVTTGGPVGL